MKTIEARRNTMAFSGLAFLTGDLGADSFFPPGNVADFPGDLSCPDGAYLYSNPIEMPEIQDTDFLFNR